MIWPALWAARMAGSGCTSVPCMHNAGTGEKGRGGRERAGRWPYRAGARRRVAAVAIILAGALDQVASVQAGEECDREGSAATFEEHVLFTRRSTDRQCMHALCPPASDTRKHLPSAWKGTGSHLGVATSVPALLFLAPPRSRPFIPLLASCDKDAFRMASVRSAGGAFLQPPRATPQAAATAAVRVPRPHTRPLLRAQATGFGDGQSTERASSPQRRSPSAGRGGRGRGRGGSAGGRSGGGRVRQPGDKPASEKQRLNKVGGNGRALCCCCCCCAPGPASGRHETFGGCKGLLLHCAPAWSPAHALPPVLLPAARLLRPLRRRGVASRRAADDLISQGKVTVNGRVVTELATQVDLRRDKVGAGARARAV